MKSLVLAALVAVGCGGPAFEPELFEAAGGAAGSAGTAGATTLGGSAGAAREGTDAGSGGTTAGGTTGSGGIAGSAGVSGTANLDAGSDTGVGGGENCGCLHQPYVAQDEPCGPPDGPGTSCLDIGKTFCYRCTCAVQDPDAGPANDQSCNLTVGIGSVASDPAALWCCT